MLGSFLTFEGPDGSGKSTVIERLKSEIGSQLPFIHFTREPGGTPISEKIRELLLDPDHSSMTSRTEALLYAASRAQHVDEVIRPALISGKLVISDRFLLSSIAYQGYGRQLGVKSIELINEFATTGLVPDLVVFFNIQPNTALERKGPVRDRLENADALFHRAVYDGYQSILKSYPHPMVVIDAEQNPDRVYDDVVRILEPYLEAISCQ